MACKNCNGNTCAALTARLQAIDFAIVDTALYLDAYPNEQKALDYYHRLRRERKSVADALHAQCGPTTAWENESTTSWDWVKGPWPWEEQAN